jgi:diacylglycerol kinase (ATP)
MNVIINKYAAGGTAEKKWELIKDLINQRFDNINLIDVQNQIGLANVIKEAIVEENKDFIIAGGDGTINLFLNKAIEIVGEKTIKLFRFGAIGIGSSNDFHKPFQADSTILGIPIKTNFKDSQLRDVGIIRYKSGLETLQKYFLLNASIGVTAEANNLFNHPDRILYFLKKRFTSLAILYAALRTIFTYKNSEVKISSDSTGRYSLPISNLSITKSPHFSGDLCYPNEADYQNGLYDIYLAHSMNKYDLIKLLTSLGKKTFPENKKTKHSRTSKIIISSKANFLIEFDGETITTNYAEFSILKEYLKICIN